LDGCSRGTGPDTGVGSRARDMVDLWTIEAGIGHPFANRCGGSRRRRCY